MKPSSKKTFAENVFDEAKMKKFLPPKTYEALMNARSSEGTIAQKDLEIFAKALKKWAISKGVTRFTHWFQPLNNYTAEKRDSIYSLDKDSKAIEKFRGKELCIGEGDASSFPSGGLRQTFEARGITKWDATSYAFIKDGCLCIPTTFYSYDNVSLDKKSPLVKSCVALRKQTLRILRLLGYGYKTADSFVGAEQEYFLIDKQSFEKRADLVYCGRTLFGNSPVKGQEFCDHYFRPIPPKIAEFMKDVDDELFKLGIIVKTEHNEVAPGQFELAPSYAPANIACDQNQIIMETLKKTADKHGLACLLHEKPFNGLNGSGKHNNWSLLADNSENLLEIGGTPKENARFMLLLAAVVSAVDKYSDLLSASVSSAANDCRLGETEAPPKIISIFIGNLQSAVNAALQNEWRAGIDPLPVTAETTDRNRTSPFAYTGNKFEFRMAGSSATVADVNTALNTAVAEQLRRFAEKLERSQNIWNTLKEIVTDAFTNHKNIIFDGDNYSAEWFEEAKKRNLSNLTTVQSYLAVTSGKNVELFEKHNVLSKNELKARQNVLLETYCNTVKLELRAASDIALRQILPAAEKYVQSLVETANGKKQLDLPCDGEKEKIRTITELTEKCLARITELQALSEKSERITDLEEKTSFCEKNFPSAIKTLRINIDKLEKECPKEVWPMPSVADLLF